MQLFFTSNICKGKFYEKTIAIDLDGVLNEYTKYTDSIPPIRKGAKEFIIELSKEYNLVLFTTRNSKKATEWLQENKIDKYFTDVTNNKIPAYIYIDDRSIRFEGEYDKIFEKIKDFNVYWKKP